MSRHRKNIAKLVEINNEVTKERDALRADLATEKAALAKSTTENYEQSREIANLKLAVTQKEAVLREHKVPRYFYEPGHFQGTSL